MSLPPELSLEDIKVQIGKSIRNPNVGEFKQVTLKEGPRAFRIATLFEIIDPKSNEVHHYSLRIDSLNKTKKGWFHKPEKSVWLEGKKPDEIDRLFQFLRAHSEGKLSDATGNLHIITGREYEKLENLIDLIPDLASPDMVELVKLIVPRIRDAELYSEDFINAFKESSPQTVDYIALTASLVSHTRSYDQLKELIESNETSEQKYQELLAENPWMFGSEYSELLDRRSWTRDDNLDFMLRRTVDNYLEIIEIKTAFPDPLFIYDSSHDSHHPSAILSRVIGQVMRYIAEIERSRDAIISKDKCDTLKIRARIIIGCDGNEKEQEALHKFNSHLHGIEVFTFDQLLRIAGKVIEVFDATPSCEEADIPDDSPF